MRQEPGIEPSDVVAVIPARHGSQRFPGKPLADLHGRPLIAHVVDAARAARRVGAVLVATDHAGIADAARAAGADAVLTREDHPSGSDRIGEAVAGRPESIILNVQGDEPFVPAPAIDALVQLLEDDPDAGVSTLGVPLSAGDPAEADPNVVKVVRSRTGRALYFSRAPIPAIHPDGDPNRAEAVPRLRHLGLYGYRRSALDRFLEAAPAPLERREGLEQLRLLDLGIGIAVGTVGAAPPGVDTPEDLDRARAWRPEVARPDGSV